MRIWRPLSWSQQARKMCDLQVEYVNYGHSFIEDSLNLISNSYRAPIIRQRAAKRFGKLVRSGKVKENLEAFIENYPMEAKARGLIK